MSLIASVVMGSLGFYFLANGKKTQNINKMLLGGACIVGSYWLF